MLDLGGILLKEGALNACIKTILEAHKRKRPSGLNCQDGRRLVFPAPATHQFPWKMIGRGNGKNEPHGHRRSMQPSLTPATRLAIKRSSARAATQKKSLSYEPETNLPTRKLLHTFKVRSSNQALARKRHQAVEQSNNPMIDRTLDRPTSRAIDRPSDRLSDRATQRSNI